MISRRAFSSKLITKFMASFFMLELFVSCKSKTENGTANEEAIDLDVSTCDDLSEVAEVEIKKRQALGYSEKTPIDDQNCKNCKLFIPAPEGKPCGGCILFKGPVFEAGYCTYWAEII